MATQKDYCAHCGDKATIPCSRCGDANYCTEECLEADEHTHKTLCEQSKDFKARPHPYRLRAIYLPENEEKPRFVWAPCFRTEADHEMETDADLNDKRLKRYEIGADSSDSSAKPSPGASKSYAKHKNILPLPEIDLIGETAMRSTTVLVDGWTPANHISHGLELYHRENFRGDQSKVNKCLEYLSKGRTKGYWKGPLLLYGVSKTNPEDVGMDLDASDLTVAIEGILDHELRQQLFHLYFTSPAGQRTHLIEKVPGVKVNASAPFFEDVKIPVEHPIFFDGAKSTVSKKMGLEIRTYHCTSSTHSNAPWDEPAVPAAYLHVTIDLQDSYQPHQNDIGKIPQGWVNNTRSMLLVKANQKDSRELSATLVEMLCKYVKEQAEGIRAANTSPEAVKKYIEEYVTSKTTMEFVYKTFKESPGSGKQEKDIKSKFDKMLLGKARKV